jgi:DNA repair photolyase
VGPAQLFQMLQGCQPAQTQERAKKLTLHILEIAATKVVPVLIATI